VNEEEAAVDSATTYRYEVGVALLLANKLSLEVAEVALRVLDWTD
jgi:hypothetical protein